MRRRDCECKRRLGPRWWDRAACGTRVLRVCAYLLLICGNRMMASSPEHAAVSGIVTEGLTGELIASAVVSIRADSMGVKKTREAVSNRFGFYSFGDVPPGLYIFAVRAAGYRFARDTVILVPRGGALRVDLEVEPYDLSEVVVYATHDRSNTVLTGTSELSPGLVRQLPSIGGEPDVFRALQLLPGVKALSEASSGLYVRGGAPDQNLVLLDGVVVYNPSHLGGFLSTFNADAIRDIKFIKGAPPAEYGGRLSSVLDMTMREGSREKFSGTAGLSVLDARAMVEGPFGTNGSFMLSARRMYLDLILLAAGDSTAPNYAFYDLNWKVNFRLGDDDRLYASGYFGRDVIESSPSDKDAFEIRWGNLTGNLRWTHIFSSVLFSSVSAVVTDYTAATSLGEPRQRSFESRSAIRDYMVRGEAQVFPSDDHTIKLGVESTIHLFDAGVRTSGSNSEERSERKDALDVALYLQDEWTLSPRLSTNVGARLYYFDGGEYLRVEPRLTLAFRASDLVTVKGAFALGNQFVHMISRNDILLPTEVWLPSSASTKPAEGYHGVLAVEGTTDDEAWRMSVELYYRRMSNLLEYRDQVVSSLDIPLEETFARGEGVAYGGELFLRGSVAGFTGWVGYTLSWTERTFDELNGGRPFAPRYDRRHDVSVVAAYRLNSDWTFAATWVYNTGAAFTMPTGQYAIRITNGDEAIGFGGDGYVVDRLGYAERNGYRLPAYHKLDLAATFSFEWLSLSWKLSMSIYNAYNRQNVFGQAIYWESIQDPVTNDYRRVVRLRRTTLFPIIPSVGLSVTW